MNASQRAFGKTTGDAKHSEKPAGQSRAGKAHAPADEARNESKGRSLPASVALKRKSALYGTSLTPSVTESSTAMLSGLVVTWMDDQSRSQ